MQDNKNLVWVSLFISVFFVLFLFILQGHKEFSLWDEGFLWYGAQRVMLGEVPVRDFMAYDPGRYYWAAGIMSLLGDGGIISLRIALAFFQFFGLFVGLLLISRTVDKRKDHFSSLILSGIILLIWMFPRHKLFDTSLSIFLVGVLTFLVERPDNRRHFFSGLLIGLIAVFGRNHGFYGVVGYIGATLWLSMQHFFSWETIKKVLLYGGGVIVGYAPMLLMMAFVPGFGRAYLENLLLPFQQGVTNLPLPVPWPWLVNVASMPIGEAVRGLLIGLFFIAVLVFGPFAIGWLIYKKSLGEIVPPVFAATAFMMLPYAHNAFSRADVGHLAQGIFPFLIGCLVLFLRFPHRLNLLLTAGLCIASLWVMLVFQPGWVCLAGPQCSEVEISGNNLMVDQGTANDIAFLHQIVDEYASNGKNFVVTPFWPGAYPIFERKSPMMDIYAIWPRSASFEKEEIERIKAAEPGFVLVLDFPLDGREELRFKNTHPLVYRYIFENFEFLPDSPNPQYQLYKALEAE